MCRGHASFVFGGLGGGTALYHVLLCYRGPRVIDLMFSSGFKGRKFWFMVYNLFRALDYILVIFMFNNRIFLLFNGCHGWFNILHCITCVHIYQRCAYVISVLSFIDKKKTLFLSKKVWTCTNFLSCCIMFDLITHHVSGACLFCFSGTGRGHILHFCATTRLVCDPCYVSFGIDSM